ncbi:MAG: ribose 5-phosphate isomerase B [Armatimonadetes bacterium]|nr:ribose 5-phosphate isomerase B [Armatimonadota bacterium]
MTVAIGNDHAGVELKRALMEHLADMGVEVEDFGTGEHASCDYPDYAARVARAVADGRHELGVLICGTGIGMSMAANKVEGVRAALCCCEYHARMAREHNGANVLCLGARVTGEDVARAILTVFIQTPVSTEERHARRRGKIMALEG